MIPYYQQLHSKRKAVYRAEIEEIAESLLGLYVENDGNVEIQLNRTLTETYLLGYYLQRKELREKIYKKKDAEEN